MDQQEQWRFFSSFALAGLPDPGQSRLLWKSTEVDGNWLASLYLQLKFKFQITALIQFIMITVS